MYVYRSLIIFIVCFFSLLASLGGGGKRYLRTGHNYYSFISRLILEINQAFYLTH